MIMKLLLKSFLSTIYFGLLFLLLAVPVRRLQHGNAQDSIDRCSAAPFHASFHFHYNDPPEYHYTAEKS